MGLHRALRLAALAAAGAWIALALGVGEASAAKLVGGARQAAIDRAFFARGAHRGQLIVSTRVSTVAPAWAVVKSVAPQAGGRTNPGARPPALDVSFYHLVSGRELPGSPPAPARSDLMRRFSITVVYAGSGSESIAYHQAYDSVCLGQGGFTDSETDSVRPMTWTVRYVVDPDDLLAAVRSSAETMLAPQVSFARVGSSLSAIETLSRTVVDVGCAGRLAKFTCTETFGLAPSGSALRFVPNGGIEVGVPTSASKVGACASSDYTLGPSLWDSGATTARVPALGVIGGSLPTDPYAAVKVAWPAQSAAAGNGFVAGPCQGDGAACSDAFAWTGTVSLVSTG